jgi:hypothetical protein
MPDPHWHGLVRDAWNSIRAKVASQIPPAVKGKPLSDQSYRDKFRLCSTLNFGGRGSAFWGDDGEGTLTLTSVQVSEFNGVKAGDIEFNGLEVRLPLPFALLQATGRYSYVQPCALYSLGKKTSGTNLRGNGTMTAKAEDGAMKYLMQVIDPDHDLRLQLTGATVDGRRTTAIKPDGEPDNEVLRWLVDVFGRGLQEKRSIQASLETFFGQGQFGRDMAAELNKIINQELARTGSRS